MSDTAMTYAGPAGAALNNPQAAMQVCQTLVASRLLPAGVQTPEQAFVILQTGAELGLGPMQALRSIHVVKGRPILSAQLMVAMVLRSGDCRYFRRVGGDQHQATYETLREGMPEPVTLTYTLDEAKAAGLLRNDNWKKHPAAMLRARASSALARDVYPDLVAGLYTPDEGREIAGDPDALDVRTVSRSPQAAPAASVGGARDSLMDRLADEGVDADDLLAFVKATTEFDTLPADDAGAARFEVMFFPEGLRAFRAWRAGRSADTNSSTNPPTAA